MRLSLSWLKEHLDFDLTADQVSSLLTDLGLEVEQCNLDNPSLQEMIICEIKKIDKHPNADRLSICKVSSKNQVFSVVCGAKNIYENMKTVFAPNGTYIPGKKFKLEKKNIRGIEGDGMLCSEEELGISDNSEGIIDLRDNFIVGESYGRHIQEDFIFEIGLTPNRGDCASVRGIARELAAKLSSKIKIREINNSKGDFESSTKWDLSGLHEAHECPLIMGREFRIEKNGKSPFYLRSRLLQIGVTPNSALVDITNYILFDLGRPLHVFDLEKIKGDLTVRRAKKDEKFLGLDNKVYSLSEKDLVIADEEKIVSLAGIMGSINSCVDENTKKVFLEVAYFDPIIISETGRRHNIITDARYRFERGIDKAGLKEGLETATEMIIRFCKGSFSNEVSAGDSLKCNPIIKYNTNIYKSISGYELSSQLQINYLERLGFNVKKEEFLLLVTAPSWRHDITNANDLVEEILRLDGYDKIPNVNISKDIKLSKNFFPISCNAEIDLRYKLSNMGLNEIKSFTFLSPQKIIPSSELNNALKIINPISNELSVMRNSLYPNLLDAVSKNYSKGVDSFSLYELGDIFTGIEYSSQEKQAGIVLSGFYKPKTWHSKRRYYDFFDIKAIIKQIVKETFNLFTLNLTRSKSEYYHPGKSADLILNNKKVGSFGELHPKLMKQFYIKQQTVLGFLSIDLLLNKYKDESKSYNLKMSPYLTLKKDFSFILPKNTRVEDLINLIKNSSDKIGEVLVFDIYENKGKTSGISIGIEVEILQEDKVFNSKEINEIMSQIILTAEKNAKAKLRT